MSNGEKMVQANGVDLCVETFGEPANPAVLLVHGASASMLWWEDELCERIAAAGRYVVRYDNRDTGRSVSYPPGQPGYSLRDMAGDALGVLDALGIERAHLVGASMAGAIVLLAERARPERVASLTLVTTTTGEPGLPPSSPRVSQATAGGGPDPTDLSAVVDFVVSLMKVYSGPSVYFDEVATRRLVERDVARTVSVASCLINHFVIDTSGSVAFGEVAAPTLVVHGSDDPVFPIEHGQALQRAIPGAELLVLDKAGHEVPAPLWDTFIPALVKHTTR